MQNSEPECILSPIDATLKLTMNKSPDASPRTEVDLTLNCIGIVALPRVSKK
jgi:hypothetical protein